MSKKNFTISTVATAPSPTTSGTSLVVATGTGSLFAANEPAVICPANTSPDSTNSEIVTVSDVTDDTLTIVREQESTTARDIQVGDVIFQQISAKDWNDLVTLVGGKIAKTTNITSLNETGIADGEVAIFNLTNKDIRTSNVLISTDGTLAGDADTNIPTEKAVKTYVDNSSFTWKGEWVTATAYAVNDTVEYNGSGYICVIAHTSGTFATDLTNGNWEMFVEGVSADSIASTIHGATAKTTPVDADEVGLIDSAASNVLKKLTWSNIKATLKSYFDSVTTTLTNKTLSSPLFTGTIDGWIGAGETWTYASADDPTFTFTISGDKTSKYSAGMRIKLTQTSVKYFIITVVSYSSPNTTITVYGGTDYDLANATITSPYYSTQKAPQGFPLNPAKWSVITTNTTDAKETNPTASTYYNLGSINLVLPIGAWKLSYQVNFEMKSSNSVTLIYGNVALGTTNSSAVDDFEAYCVESSASSQVQSTTGIYRESFIEVTTKTTYYLNARAGMTLGTTGYLLFAGLTSGNTIIRAVCAYL